MVTKVSPSADSQSASEAPTSPAVISAPGWSGAQSTKQVSPGQRAGQRVADVGAVDLLDLRVLDRGQHRLDREKVDRLVPQIADRDLADPDDADITHDSPRVSWAEVFSDPAVFFCAWRCASPWMAVRKDYTDLSTARILSRFAFWRRSISCAEG